MRDRDAAVRERLLDLFEHAFGAAMEQGRLEPALGALKGQAEISGVLHRSLRPSAVQRAHARDLREPDEAGDVDLASAAVVSGAPGKL